MKKHIFSALTAAVMICTGVAGAAAESMSVRYDSGGFIELVADTTLSEGAALSLHLNTAGSQSSTEMPQLSEILYAGEGGSVSERIKVSPQAYSGKYYVFVGYDGADMTKSIGSIIIYDINGARAKELAAKLDSAASAAEFAAALETADELAAFGIDKENEPYYDDVMKLAYNIKKAEKITLTPSAFCEIYRYASVVTSVKKGADTDSVMKANADVFDSDYKTYAENSSALDKMFAAADFNSGRMTLAALKVLSDVRSSELSSELKTAVENGCGIIGLEMGSGSDYGKIAKSKQPNVFSKMIKTSSGIKNSAELIASFESAVKEVLSESASGSSSGGGSGGGGKVSGGSGYITQPDITGAIENPSKNTYSDISGHFAYDAVMKLSKSGIINGYGDGTFRPQGKITRAEAAKLICAAFKTSASNGAKFSDVSAGSWYYGYVDALSADKIIEGDGQLFRPDDNITREDMTVILSRALKSRGIELSGEHTFSDSADISGYAAPHVSAFAAAGIVRGDGTNFFPKSDITRGEAAAIIFRILESYGGGI